MSSRTHALLVAVLIATGLAGCGKDAEKHLAAGKDLLQAGKHKDAVLELKTALQAQPNNAQARMLLGRAHQAAGALAEAEKEFRKALDLGGPVDEILPDLARVLEGMSEFQKVLDIAIPPGGALKGAALAAVHTTRAKAFLGLKQTDKAEAEIVLAAQADAGLPDLAVLQARRASETGQFAEAMHLIEAAQKRDPLYVEAYYVKASLRDSQHDPDAALASLTEVSKIDSRAFRAHLAMADIHLRRNDLKKAEESLLAAESAAPNVTLVKYARAVFELRRNDLKAANDAILQVLKSAPNYLPAQLVNAMINLGLGNPEQSMKSAQLVLAKHPDNVAAARVLAASQLRAGDARNALNTLSPLLKANPDDASLLSLAGEAYMKNNNFGHALGLLSQAEKKSPNDPVLKGLQAENLLAMGQTERAVEALEKAASMSDKAGRADIAVIGIHMRRGDFDKALAAVDALEKKLPNNPVTFNLRAAAQAGKGDRAGARLSLEKALALDPNLFPTVANLAKLDLTENKVGDAKRRFETLLQRDEKNLGAMLALAELALRDKREADYVRWLEKAAAARPEALEPKALLSRYHLSRKEPGKALESAALAVKNNPNDANALTLLGATQLMSKNASAAVETYSKLVEQQPKSPDALLRLAEAQFRSGQAGAARTSLNKALGLKADFLPALEARVRLDITEKKYAEALSGAKALQATAPKSPRGYVLEGDVYLVQKQTLPAMAAYEKALQAQPEVKSFIKLQNLMRVNGRQAQADARIAQWIQQFPKDLDVRFYSAEISITQKQPAAAIAKYEQILAIAPDNLIALNNVATLHQQQNNLAKAREYAERALKINPTSPALLDTLGWILTAQKDYARALPMLRQAAEKLPNVPEVRYHHGVALAGAGKKSEAKTELNAALAAKQGFADAEAAKTLLRSL